jgi:hypothetical protein
MRFPGFTAMCVAFLAFIVVIATPCYGESVQCDLASSKTCAPGATPRRGLVVPPASVAPPARLETRPRPHPRSARRCAEHPHFTLLSRSPLHPAHAPRPTHPPPMPAGAAGASPMASSRKLAQFPGWSAPRLPPVVPSTPAGNSCVPPRCVPVPRPPSQGGYTVYNPSPSRAPPRLPPAEMINRPTLLNGR